MNIKQLALALHAVRLTSNTLFSTSSSPTCAALFIFLSLFFIFFYSHFSMQLPSHEYKQPLKWQLQSACLYLCICVCVSSWAHSNTLKIWPTNSSSSRMSAQPSYQSMMNRMENVSYLVLPTCSSSDRSATAPKSIRDCTFLLYWIPTHILFWQGKRFTILHHRCHVIFKYVRAYIF